MIEQASSTVGSDLVCTVFPFSKMFLREGGWGPGPTVRKQSEQRLFSPQLILQFTEGSNGFITEKTILFQGFRGDPTFSRGVQLFSTGGGGGGVQMLISIETHIT